MKEKSKTMISVFPHGIFANNFNLIGGAKAGTSFKKCISSILINIPIFGYLLEKLDFVDISKTTLNNLMQKKENIMILPGGFNEVFMTKPYEYNIFIPRGFIKYACKYNYTIIPVLSLGENETFYAITPPKFLYNFLFKFLTYIPVPLALPFSSNIVPIKIFYGEKIICNPEDDIEIIRNKMIEEIKNIFHKNIEKYVKYRNKLNIKPIVNSEMYKINFYP